MFGKHHKHDGPLSNWWYVLLLLSTLTVIVSVIEGLK